MQEQQEAMVKSLVAVAWADGRVDGEESEVIEALLSAFEIDGADAAAIREFAKTPKTLDDVPLTELSTSDRRLLLQHAVVLTYIDGKQSEEETKILQELVSRLRIPGPEAKQLLEASEVRAKKLLDLLIARELDALLLDAGNTVVFLDHDALAEVAGEERVSVDPRELERIEGRAKRRYEKLMREGASHEHGWRLYLITLLEEGGVAPAAAEALIAPLRRAHDTFNFWRRVPAGLPAALDRARQAGLRIAIVSNSEGRLPELFARVGLGDAFEIVVDSAHEGVRKPDPEIFWRATQRLGIAPARALYAGDLPDVDIAGAHAAGLHAALIDPLDFYPDETRAPRYPSVAALIDDLVSARAR